MTWPAHSDERYGSGGTAKTVQSWNVNHDPGEPTVRKAAFRGRMLVNCVELNSFFCPSRHSHFALVPKIFGAGLQRDARERHVCSNGPCKTMCLRVRWRNHWRWGGPCDRTGQGSPPQPAICPEAESRPDGRPQARRIARPPRRYEDDGQLRTRSRHRDQPGHARAPAACLCRPGLER